MAPRIGLAPRWWPRASSLPTAASGSGEVLARCLLLLDTHPTLASHIHLHQPPSPTLGRTQSCNAPSKRDVWMQTDGRERMGMRGGMVREVGGDGRKWGGVRGWEGHGKSGSGGKGHRETPGSHASSTPHSVSPATAGCADRMRKGMQGARDPLCTTLLQPHVEGSHRNSIATAQSTASTPDTWNTELTPSPSGSPPPPSSSGK